LRKAVTGAGATAAALGTNAVAGLAAQETASPVPGIKIPAEFEAAKTAVLPKLEFPLSGAQVFARVCKDEGVAALFCCPGNYTVIHAVASTGIQLSADATKARWRTPPTRSSAARASSRPGRVPKGRASSTIICFAAANAARTPLLFLASNMAIAHEDMEAGIQLAYQQPVTEGFKKYGRRLINPSRVHEYAGYAFRILKSGVPKPVHLDFPAEVTSAKFKDASEPEYYHGKARYRTDSRAHPSPKDITKAIDMIKVARRPLIVSSNGVFHSKGWDALKQFAEKGQIPVAESGAMKGQFSDASPLSANAAPGRTFARNPKLYPPRQLLSEHIRLRSTLSAHARELLILRPGWLARSEYEWAQHVRNGRQAGLDSNRIASGADAPGWDPFDVALVRAADELYRDDYISDATWTALAARFNASELMDVLITAGGYRMVSMALNAFGVQLEPGAERFPVAPTR
jgi:4-carboxymuconolactone decarboxylase